MLPEHVAEVFKLPEQDQGELIAVELPSDRTLLYLNGQLLLQGEKINGKQLFEALGEPLMQGQDISSKKHNWVKIGWYQQARNLGYLIVRLQAIVQLEDSSAIDPPEQFQDLQQLGWRFRRLN